MVESTPAPVDVVVGGGGAAGLMAAICAAQRGLRVTLLEKNARLGLKILISGGGRCNLTTTKTGRDLEREYGVRRGRWLRHALRSFPPERLRELVEDAGVPLQEEDLDKVFPVSGKARDVVEALATLARDAGVERVHERPIDALRRAGDAWHVRSGGACWRASAVVLAMGGLSYPRTGTTGDGYRLLTELGHTIVPTVPHLAPLAVEASWVRALAGITLTGVALSVWKGGERLCVRQRPILFTHKGLSGPAPMDLAGFVEEVGGGCDVRFDFVPGVDFDSIDRELQAAAQADGRRPVESALPGELPARLRRALVELCDAAVPLAELRREARRRVVLALKELRVPVERSLGFAHAEVTRGGIPLDEIDARTMQSKVAPGIYVCGELLDIDGPIGGFNFQAAFATGRLAGLAAGG